METSEEFELTIEDRPSYVFARITGKRTRPISVGADPYLESIAKHCAKCMCPAILIEKHTSEAFDVWDTFAMAPHLSKIDTACIRVAVVEKGAALAAKTHLTVVVGHNCGLDVQVFSHSSEAKSWLWTGDR